MWKKVITIIDYYKNLINRVLSILLGLAARKIRGP